MDYKLVDVSVPGVKKKKKKVLDRASLFLPSFGSSSTNYFSGCRYAYKCSVLRKASQVIETASEAYRWSRHCSMKSVL